MSTSNSIGIITSVVAINAANSANIAKQQANKVLLMACKKDYSENECSSVCKETSSFKIKDTSKYKADYQYTTINNCTSTTPIISYENHINEKGFGLWMVGIISFVIIVWVIGLILEKISN
jgi:hypothetical protein